MGAALVDCTNSNPGAVLCFVGHLFEGARLLLAAPGGGVCVVDGGWFTVVML